MRTFRTKYLECHREKNQGFNGSCKPFTCKITGGLCHSKGCPDPQDSTDALVNRFLAWPLPDSVCSDPCASMPGYPHRVGTNLLTAVEAKQMIEFLLKRGKGDKGNE